jgi:hypothetical protein
MLAGITPVIEDIVGPVIPKTYTEVVSGSEKLRLGVTPLISVTSVVPFTSYGTSYVPASMRWTENGVVVLNYGGCFYGDRFTVTYVAGRKPVPPNISLAAKMILKHMWESQRGSSGTPYQGDPQEDFTVTPSGYLIPYRASALLTPHELGPSVG